MLYKTQRLTEVEVKVNYARDAHLQIFPKTYLYVSMFTHLWPITV